MIKKAGRIGFAPLVSHGQVANERARRIADDSRKYIQKREGIEVFCPDDPIISLEDASRAVSMFRRSEIDALVIQHCMHSPGNLSAELVRDLPVPLAVWAVPEIPFDSNPLNCASMMSALGHAAALTAMGRRFTFVYGLADAEEARRDLDKFVKAVMVRRALRRAAIALIGYKSPSMYAATIDEVLIKNVFGTEVRHVSLADVIAEVRQLQPEEIDADLREVKSGDYLVEVTDPDALRRSCAAYVAIRKIVERNGFAAIATKCWPELTDGEKLGICVAHSRLTDSGIPSNCDGDVDGALTMLIQHLYTGRPPFYANWLQRDDKNNVVQFWACGSAPASLVSPRFEPKITDSQRGENTVIFDFPLKTGEVTLARLQSFRGVCKLLLVRGRAVETPPALKGTYVAVRFEPPVRVLLDTIIKHGFPQHVSIVYEDIEGELTEFAEQLGMEVVTPPKT